MDPAPTPASRHLSPAVAPRADKTPKPVEHSFLQAEPLELVLLGNLIEHIARVGHDDEW